MRIGILFEIKKRILFSILKKIEIIIIIKMKIKNKVGIMIIMLMIMKNMGFYVSECIDEPPSITPPGVSKRLEYPRPFPDDFPHTS